MESKSVGHCSQSTRFQVNALFCSLLIVSDNVSYFKLQLKLCSMQLSIHYNAKLYFITAQFNWNMYLLQAPDSRNGYRCS